MKEFILDTLEEGEKILDKVPALARLSSWNFYKKPMRENHFKYIIWLYDKDSPLNNVRPSIPLGEKKLKAAEYSELKFDADGKPTPATLRLFSLEEDSFRNLVLDYLKYQNNLSWSYLVSVEQNMWEAIQILLKPVGEDDYHKALESKAKIRLQMPQLEKTLKDLEKKVYLSPENAEEVKKGATTIESIILNK